MVDIGQNLYGHDYETCYFDMYSFSELDVRIFPKLASRSMSDNWLKSLSRSPSNDITVCFSVISMSTSSASHPVSKFSSPLSLQYLHSIPGQLTAS